MNQTNLQTKIEKSNLAQFYEGWPHFATLDLHQDYAVFGLSNSSRVAAAIEKANKRIAEKQLPLEALSTGKFSNTFIVKEKGVNHVC